MSISTPSRFLTTALRRNVHSLRIFRVFVCLLSIVGSMVLWTLIGRTDSELSCYYKEGISSLFVILSGEQMTVQ